MHKILLVLRTKIKILCVLSDSPIFVLILTLWLIFDLFRLERNAVDDGPSQCNFIGIFQFISD